MCYKEEKWEIGFFLFFFFPYQSCQATTAPPKRRETPCTLPPPESAASPAAVPPAHVGHSTEAPRHPLPGCRHGASHATGQLLPTPRAGPKPRSRLRTRTPRAGLGGHVGTRGSQDRRIPPPGRGQPRARASCTRRPRRQPVPAVPTNGRCNSPPRRGSGSCGLGPTQAWLRPRALTTL